LIYLISLALYFVVAICAATSSVVVLAAEAEMPWLWWSTLFPLATLHAASGSLAFRKDVYLRKAAFICGAVSGVTTLLAIVIARRLELSMPRHLAWAILVGATLAGLFGVALARRAGTGRIVMKRNSSARLKAAIDQLEPESWLLLDEVSFPAFFQGPLHHGSRGLASAEQFAKQNGYILVFDSVAGVAKFSRAD
jgi:hypothetical protein